MAVVGTRYGELNSNGKADDFAVMLNRRYSERSYFSQESLQSHTQHAMVTCDTWYVLAFPVISRLVLTGKTSGKELRKKNISRHRKRYCNPKASSPLSGQ